MDCSSPIDVVLTPGTVIMSPNYPKPYTNNLDCQVTIRSANSKKVLIEFDPVFGMDQNHACQYDYLEVRDGPSSSSNLIGKFCYNVAPSPIQSTGNAMTLIFHTDFSNIYTGFKITANPGRH